MVEQSKLHFTLISTKLVFATQEISVVAQFSLSVSTQLVLHSRNFLKALHVGVKTLKYFPVSLSTYIPVVKSLLKNAVLGILSSDTLLTPQQLFLVGTSK